jgi:hypothetical protein
MKKVDGRRSALSATTLLSMLLASALAMGCQRTPFEGPSMPFEDEGACPFEGCVYRDWVANAGVAVKADRWIGAPVRFRLRKGDRARALTGVVVTLRAGRVRFKHAVDLQSGNDTIHVEPTHTLFLLTYHGEGVTTAWHQGRIYDNLDGSEFLNTACELTPGACNGSVVEQPRRMWWVQVQNAKGDIGWTHEPDKFDHKSALE